MREEDVFMEAVVKYLDNNTIPYKWHWDDIKAFVRDRYEAHTLCAYFQIHTVYYEENGVHTELFGPEQVKQGRGLFPWDYENTPITPLRDKKPAKKQEQPNNGKEFMGLFDSDKPLTIFPTEKEAVQGQFFNEKKHKKYAI